MTQLFGIELAYSHNVLFRLFVGLMEINPVFLLISLCISLVLGILSFYYEYSYFSWAATGPITEGYGTLHTKW